MYLRHPKTKNELKAWFSYVDLARDYPQLKFKGRRSKRKIPTAWDDIWIDAERCWKAHRTHQYKVETPSIKRNSDAFARSMAKRDHWHYHHGRCAYYPCGYCKRHNVKYLETKLIRRKRRNLYLSNPVWYDYFSDDFPELKSYAEEFRTNYYRQFE